MWSELRRDPNTLDQATLERAYVKLEKPMFNIVYRWLWNASDAREVTQEAFLKVWDARERVDPTTLEPLLYRTALNLASNRRRSARLWRWLGLEAVSDEESRAPRAEDALGASRDRARVRAAVEALPDRLREIVMLAEYAELCYGEIATTLGIPVGTVGSRRNAALAELAEALGPFEEIE